MKEHGILFSTPMVRALLAGRKSQTRRMSERWMKVKAGDVLWVRESWRTALASDHLPPSKLPLGSPIFYESDCPERDKKHSFIGKLRPSMFMPRWASRVTLIATEDAREQELWDIKAWECVAEGIEGDIGNAVPNFARLWDSLHGKDAPLDSNPTVIRLAFAVKGMQ